MRYVSTRGETPNRTFMETVLEGLAPDGGLFMPESYPQLNLGRLRLLGYPQIATCIIHAFADDISISDARALATRTYTAQVFGTKQITPVQKLDEGIYLLHLSNGPTLAFKDVALQLLGSLMQYVLEKQGRTLNILGATSGDTGSAAEYAVRGKSGMNIVMLSPYGRMSAFQRRQMLTLNEPNIHNLSVNGTFDDCQAVVKAVFADAEFKEQHKLGAVNSINWARIAAQVVYYVYAYLQVTTDNTQHVTFAVPSGNFGDAFAAYVAKRMGLPISIIVATNENDVLHEFFQTGTYRVRKGSDVKITSSPSMDIASASNFERLLYDCFAQDPVSRDRAPATIQDLWDELGRTGKFGVPYLLDELAVTFRSGMATDLDVLRTIGTIHRKYGIIIDPHTAVAMKVGLDFRECGDIKGPLVIAETALAAKFGDTIREALGFEAPVPIGYESLGELPEYSTRIDPDPEAVKRLIVELCV